MSFDAYEVAVRLKLEDQFSAGMDKVAQGLREATRQADALFARLEQIRTLLKSPAAPKVAEEAQGAMPRTRRKPAPVAEEEGAPRTRKPRTAYERAQELEQPRRARAVLDKAVTAPVATRKKSAGARTTAERTENALEQPTARVTRAPKAAGGAPAPTGGGAYAAASKLKASPTPVAELDKLIRTLGKASHAIEQTRTTMGKASDKFREAEEFMKKLNTSGPLAGSLGRVITLIEKLHGWMDPLSTVLKRASEGVKFFVDFLKMLRPVASVVSSLGGLNRALGNLDNGPLKQVTSAFQGLSHVLSSGLGGSLGKIGGAVGKLILGAVSKLSAVGKVVEVAQASYKAGTVLNEAMSWALHNVSGGKIDSPGEGIYNLFNPGESSAAEHDKKLNAQIAERLAQARAARAQTTVHTTINMDGRRVAQAVSEHQARAASRPTGGTAGFDPRMAPVPVGAA